ncbi:hypothetical protein GWK47_038268 [Chionoecetes opilio]|uniref:Uncharacterized protein n=1 Tax=Chionoecetes opilio TaxID=41210 RepID=A0A8J5CYR2_CHIOP|nr:hypothetical protein GWK47_038268 [Chionoecetes opilio]
MGPRRPSGNVKKRAHKTHMATEPQTQKSAVPSRYCYCGGAKRGNLKPWFEAQFPPNDAKKDKDINNEGFQVVPGPSAAPPWDTNTKALRNTISLRRQTEKGGRL